MAVDRYKHFRWTPRTAWITVAYVCIVPSIMGYFAYTTDVSLDSLLVLSGWCRLAEWGPWG